MQPYIAWYKPLSLTDYNATISNDTRLTVTHPFLSYHGKEYILVSQYMRCGILYLQCIDESEHRIITLPASFTDFKDISKIDSTSRIKESYFTIQSLSEVESLINKTKKLST